MTRLVCLLLALVVVGTSPASDLKEPYRLKLVVSVAKSRLLTDVFRGQVTREVRDGLQAALGALARVSVTDKHPLLDEVRAKGLERAVGAYRERGPEQLHFVLIDFDGINYTVQTRQHDGLTGLPAPVVRTAATTDRAFVARLTALLIERDLGLIGTVLGEPDAGAQLKLELRGGGLGVDLARWVRKGEIFSLARLPAEGPAEPQPFLYLQVVTPPEEGVCTCRVLNRYRPGPMTGMKATLLGTRTGPVRLRLMQEGPRGQEPLERPVRLAFRQHGFDGAVETEMPGSGRGVVDTAKKGNKGTFERVVFVTVMTGETTLARIPIPLLDDRVTVLPVPLVSEDSGALTDRFRRLAGSVIEACRVQNLMFDDINKLAAKPERRAAAIARVRETLDRLRTDHERLTRERDELAAELKASDVKPKPNLALVDNRLKELKAGETELQAHIGALEKIEQEENDPRRREWLVKKAEADSLVKRGEIGKALEVYRELAKAVPTGLDAAGVKKHLADLEDTWKPVSEAHAAGRAFLYDTYPGLTTAQLGTRAKDVQTALAVCLKAGDRFAAAKFREAALAHVGRMVKELEALKPGVNSDDERPAEAIKELLPELRKQVEEAEAVLKK